MKVFDYWSMKNDDPPLDTDLGGTNSILAQRGSVVDGTLVRVFRISTLTVTQGCGVYPPSGSAGQRLRYTDN